MRKEISIEIPIEEIMDNERAGNIDTIYWKQYAGSSSTATYNLRIGVSWSSSAGSGGSNVTAKCWLGSARISTSSGARACSITINGSAKSANVDVNHSTDTPRTKEMVSNTVWVSYYGSKTITVTAIIDIKITYSGTYVGTMQIDQSAGLDTIPLPAPTNVTLSGTYAKGASHTISWSTSSGMSYQVFVSYLPLGGSWTGWQHYADVGGGSSYKINYGDNPNNYVKIQVGVRATAGGQNTGVVGTGQQIRRTLRVWDGSGYAYAYPKVWDGGTWQIAFARIWDGSSWKVA